MGLSPAGIKTRVRASSRRLSERSILDKFGVLQPQEVILGLLGEYVVGEERVWSGGLVQLLGDLGFSHAASRVALNRVITRGLLAPVKEGRFVFYVITPRLKLVHKEGRKQTFSPSADINWSGDWTLVWYAIPEKHRLQRARLGRWLNLRGFGALQDGTWITPGDRRKDVLELAERLEVSKHIVVFSGTLATPSDVTQIVSRGWKVNELKQMYDIFVKKFSPYLKKVKSGALHSREAFVARTRLIEMFRTTTSQDPQLSDDVLNVEWRRREAIRIFQDLQQALYLPATTYFRSSALSGQDEPGKTVDSPR
jgi:phenylacetic acid degradation operon negative regulatory protein